MWPMVPGVFCLQSIKVSLPTIQASLPFLATLHSMKHADTMGSVPDTRDQICTPAGEAQSLGCFLNIAGLTGY